MLNIGDKIDITRLRKSGNPLTTTNSDYTVVYFYPKDDTPGCTIEAKEFQDLKREYDDAGIRILGVSADDDASHKAFCDKFSLAFELATDEEGALGKDLGIFEGKYHKRSTFVLDSQGEIVAMWPDVKPMGHAREVLDRVRSLQESK